MSVVGLYLIALVVHFVNCGSLHASLTVLLVYLVIYVELGQEGLDVTKSLVRVSPLSLATLLGVLVLPLSIYEVLVRFP